MTKEEIDILWNKAMRLSIEDGDQFTRYRFAELVAAAERNRTWTQDHWTEYERSIAAAERNSWPAEMEAMERQVNILTDALAQAKAEEREACAKVCDQRATEDNWEGFYAAQCAEAIRARGETK